MKNEEWVKSEMGFSYIVLYQSDRHLIKQGEQSETVLCSKCLASQINYVVP